MFQVGDLIVYGSEGVCRVERIGPPEFSAQDQTRLYYTLKPLYREGKTYIPVDSKVFMRPVISREEAERLIGRIPSIEPNVCHDRSIRAVSEHYEGFLRTHKCSDLVRLIRTAFVKRQSALEQNKKPAAIDERYMKRAEDMLHGELAVALGISKEDVGAYIADCLQKRADAAGEKMIYPQ